MTDPEAYADDYIRWKRADGNELALKWYHINKAKAQRQKEINYSRATKSEQKRLRELKNNKKLRRWL